MNPFRSIYRLVKLAKKKRRRRKGPVIQEHHLSYDPEIKVRLYQGEHWVITLLNRRKRVSRGFIVSLKKWMLENEENAVEV